ncbi:MAG: hypothetical protein ACE5GJ_01180 [Gemmatimonadota bacterium]
MKRVRMLALVGVALLGTACADLAVENLNAPDRERAISTPGDVESLISGAFLSAWRGMHEWAPGPALSTAADEHTASWGNFMMKDISSEPRQAINNDPSYSYSYVIEDPWFFSYSALAAIRDGLLAIQGGVEIGTNGADTHRAETFARFVQGWALGHLALIYDKAFILDETTDLETAEMQPYTEVMNAALGYLDQAISMSGQSFTIPSSWMANVEVTNTELAGIAHAYKARFMASVGRTKAERDAANWSAIKSEAQQGIEFIPVGDGFPWFGGVWFDVLKTYGGTRPGWSRVDLAMLGPADQSGAWQQWEAFNAAGQYSKQEPFDIDTDDARYPDNVGGSSTPYYLYEGPSPFRPERGIYHFSPYGDNRWKAFNANNAIGNMDEIIQEELDLLVAEAELRAGNTQAAVDLINKTRVANGGLPALTTSGTSGARCTPRKANGSCGDVWDALKYEKRHEVWHTGTGIAFFDDRGWEDLRPNTPIQFPVPGKELLVLLQDIYTFGGGGEGSAPDIISDVDFDFNKIAERAKIFEKINHANTAAPAAWMH